jgi:hypothetical protein
MNEKVGVGMTVANLEKYEIHMLAIRELGPPSELGHRLLECRASATHERADGDMILCDGRRVLGFQSDNETISWMRYHIDGTDASFQKVGGGHGESLRGIWASGSAFHNLDVSLARISVWFCRNRYRAQICRRRSRREQTSWRDRLLQRELESCRFKGKNFSRLEVCA